MALAILRNYRSSNVWGLDSWHFHLDYWGNLIESAYATLPSLLHPSGSPDIIDVELVVTSRWCQGSQLSPVEAKNETTKGDEEDNP